MSRVLKQLNLFGNRNKAIFTCRFSHSQRYRSFFTNTKENYGWNIAFSFAAGCSVTGVGCYIWWKTGQDSDIKQTLTPHSVDLSDLKEKHQVLSFCNLNTVDDNVGTDLVFEKLSTSPWLESREPKLSREAFKKQVNDKITTAKNQTNDLIRRINQETGAAGFVVAVSVDGKIIHQVGFGYSDVENQVLALPNTVMRIASISKPITMAAAAKLMDQGKLDIDKPVQHYVPHWPRKSVDGEQVTITTRHLLSHLGGIRHYDKTCMKHRKRKDQSAVLEGTKEEKGKANEEIKQKEKAGEFEQIEYHLKKYFANVNAALELFKDDKLCSKPGTEFLYTTHGWTLISAVLEGASGKPFPQILKDLLNELGMENTYLDENEPLIYKRARYYKRNAAGRLVNVPYVDCSYKWAGGGMLSNVQDLTRFGNAMLYSYQSDLWDSSYSENNAEAKGSSDNKSKVSDSNVTGKNNSGVAIEAITVANDNSNNSKDKDYYKIAPSDNASDKETKSLTRYVKPKEVFLKSSTVKEMWTPVKGTEMGWDREAEGGGYGMGWGVVPHKPRPGTVQDQRFYVSHTGGAIGASSVLLIMPTDTDHITGNDKVLDMRQPVIIQTQGPHPRGIVVAIICNMQAVGLNKTAREIAKLFVDLDNTLRKLEENQKNIGSLKLDKNLERCST